MENEYNTPLSESRLPQSKPQRHKYLVELIKRRPWLFWLGVLVFLLSITTISMTSLFQAQTDSVMPPEPEPVPVATENPGVTSPTLNPRNLLYIWTLGAVALSFVAGSLIIAKQLKVSWRSLKFRQPAKFSASRTINRRQRRRKPVKLPLSPTLELSTTVSPVSAEPKPIVELPSCPIEPTVAAENPVPEAKEPTLAEIMDLRQHLSLTAILGESNRFRRYTDEPELNSSEPTTNFG